MMKYENEKSSKRAQHILLGHAKEARQRRVGDAMGNRAREAHMGPAKEGEVKEGHVSGGEANIHQVCVGHAHAHEELWRPAHGDEVRQVGAEVLDGVRGPWLHVWTVLQEGEAVLGPGRDVGLELVKGGRAEVCGAHAREGEGLIYQDVCPAQRAASLEPAVEVDRLARRQLEAHAACAQVADRQLKYVSEISAQKHCYCCIARKPRDKHQGHYVTTSVSLQVAARGSAPAP